MTKGIRFVGLDVHKETISVALAEGRGTPTMHGTIPNAEPAVRRLVQELGARCGPAKLHVVYEAGPCGFALYRLLTSMGVVCEVIAPSLIPKRAGDRVKTDRKDALQLARAARAGDLTAVRVPTALEESFRDLVRAREACVQDVRRARHRLQKLLLRRGVHAPKGVRTWSQRYTTWLATVRFDDPMAQTTFDEYCAEVVHHQDRVARHTQALEQSIARLDAELRDMIGSLQALRGVKLVTAATIAIEMGDAARFASAGALMSYAGLVPSEYSSGGTSRRGHVTKMGNAHLRRVIGEAVWSYTRSTRPGPAIRKRRATVPPEIVTIARKGETRLHDRFAVLTAKGKPRNVAATAIARELLGFIWAIGQRVHARHAAAS